MKHKTPEHVSGLRNHILRSPLFTKIIPFVLLFSVGGFIVYQTFAAGPYAAVNLSSATLSNGAQLVANSSASGGKVVVFNTISSPTPSPSPSPSPSGVTKGINDHPIWLRNAQSTSWSYYSQSGTQAVRIDMPWNVLQPTSKGQWDSMRIGLIDNFVDAMNNRGIKVLMVLTSAPQWANGSTDPNVPPTNDVDYADYLQQVMQRYGSKVEAYEIWNEPNGGWAWTNPNPVRYTQLLKAAYTRAKQVDASRVILGGSLSSTDGGPQAFLKAMYQNGAKGYFDVLSQHGYGDCDRGYFPGPYPKNYDTIFGDWTKTIYPIMQQYGDQDKRIWWTETGASTGCVTAAQQSSMLTDSFAHLKAHYIPTMDRLYWYSWLDCGGSGAEPNYGIITLTGGTCTIPNSADFQPKPAFSAFQAE